AENQAPVRGGAPGEAARRQLRRTAMDRQALARPVAGARRGSARGVGPVSRGTLLRRAPWWLLAFLAATLAIAALFGNPLSSAAAAGESAARPTDFSGVWLPNARAS